jgi:2,3-bisphosphoglycerate-independent phosphoglycerate mutase
VKYVVCVPDGCADEPHPDLGGRTPLEVADTPVLRALAARGQVGRAAVIPEGMPPGSDVGNLSILGFDPAEFHTGRAPIEAASLGLKLRADQVAYRCNLSTVDPAAGGPDGLMVDFAGGHPTTEDASNVIAALDERFGRGAGEGLEFHPGVQYRHIMVAPKEWVDADCIPPHDLTDQPAVRPTGAVADQLWDLMVASREVLAGFPQVGANQIWLWGQGFQPQLPSFADTFGISAGMVTAVDLVRGLGVLTGMDIVDLPTATGWYDTDYEGKRDVALNALRGGADLFVIHVEATDEAGHAGNVAEKVKALENWDRRILAGLVEGLDEMGDWRLLLLPDHATPLHLKTHTSDPVPYLLVDSRADGAGGELTEVGVADLPVVAGHSLMTTLVEA